MRRAPSAGEINLGRPVQVGLFNEAVRASPPIVEDAGPTQKPFLVDLPIALADGKLFPEPEGHAGWDARFPVELARRYRDNLMQLRGLRFDSGTADPFTHIAVTSRALSGVLTQLGAPHVFEEDNGDHRNRLWGRTGRLYTEVLPWFSLLLEAEKRAPS